MKPKVNRKGDEHKVSAYDQCQTPSYALDPLLPYIPKDWHIWECAAGEGNLVKTFTYYGYRVIGTDLSSHPQYGTDFFQCGIGMASNFDVLVTNPPYSIKYRWLERCYELGTPFALLMPVEMIGAARAQRAFQKYGIQLILMDKRINFKMPNLGYNGHGAQFPTAWYCWGLHLPNEINYATITRHYQKWELADLNAPPAKDGKVQIGHYVWDFGYQATTQKELNNESKSSN